MARPLSLTTRLFSTLVLAAILIGIAGLKTYEYFAYQIEREKLSVRIATASVRISKALIAPARNGDMAGLQYILSAFAASPEISCVKLVLKKLPEAQYWPYEGCAADQTDMMLYRQPVRQAMRRLGHAEIYFTDAGIEAEIRNVFFMIALGIAALMASQLAVIFWVNRYLIARPVSAIISVLSRLAQGDRTARIGRIDSSFEFSALAKSYDHMAEELAEQEKLQQEYIAKINQQHIEISQSLNYAAAIQKGLSGLDTGFDETRFDIALHQKQLAQIGGDYCVGLDLGQRYIVFFADAIGHGVPGALATMLLASAVRIVAGSAHPPDRPDAWLAALHIQFCESLARQSTGSESLKLGADAALILIDKKSDTLSLASAKMPAFRVSGDEVAQISGDRVSLGYMAEAPQTQTIELALAKAGEKLVLCTDGIFDQPDAVRNFGYGKRRFSRLLADKNREILSAAELAEKIFAEVESYAGGTAPLDDRTVLVIQRKHRQKRKKPAKE